MDQALVQYVAQKIMQDLRSATTIDDAVLDAVYCYPFIDPVRAMVKREDWPQIRMAGERGSQSAWDFAIGGLTRHIASYPEVEKYLLAAWRDKPDFAHRYHVLFRVLDLKSNDDIVSRELWDFVKFNMHEFVFARVGWYGGRNAVLESVKQRLSDATFPRTKAWVYLVSAMASPDTNAVRDLLNEHLNSPHELTREVAQYLIHNFAAIARADD